MSISHRVAYGFTESVYNPDAPYHPGETYPELPIGDVSFRPNRPYHLVRELLASLGYDRERFGAAQWNPLSEILRPGQTVVLKPNFVLSRNDSGQGIFACVTHPSILRALIDYSYIALRGEGRIVIADAPQMDCDWAELMAAERIDSIQELYRSRLGFDIELYDLRSFQLTDYRKPALMSNRTPLRGDPAGSVIIDLGRRSHFYGVANENYYGADYDRSETMKHHHGETQEYCVSRTVLSADVVISVPKMKVHKKVGVTLNLKGLVGINTNKNYLVHYTVGGRAAGGDQLPEGRPRFDRVVVKARRWVQDHALAQRSAVGDAVFTVAAGAYRTMIKPWRQVSLETTLQDAGNWYGNDSCWRMTADLATILYFAGRDGALRDTVQRRLFCLVDGIIGGENNGPLLPDAKNAGCLVMGESPVAVDLVTTRLMGFDIRKLRQFDIAEQNSTMLGGVDASRIEIVEGGRHRSGGAFFDPAWREPLLAFRPHPGWVGHIEI